MDRAIETLGEQSKANIVVDWAVAASPDIERNALVNMDLHDVSLRAALEVALSQGASEYLVGVDEGVIRIRGMIATNGVVVRSYDVRDLVAAAEADAPSSASTSSANVDLSHVSEVEELA